MIEKIYTDGLDEGIRCAMCTNTMKTDRGCDGGCVVNDTMYKRVMDVISKAIVQEVAKDGGWIPCSERLPEQFDTVLVTMADDCLGFSHELGSLDIGFLDDRLGFCGACGTYSIDKISAWQPLPAPYQKGRVKHGEIEKESMLDFRRGFIFYSGVSC